MSDTTKQLDNKLTFNGEDYEVTAVHADKATEVANSLIINKYNDTTGNTSIYTDIDSNCCRL